MGAVKSLPNSSPGGHVTKGNGLRSSGAPLLRKVGRDKSLKKPRTLAFVALTLFIIVYFFRPQDWIPKLQVIPLAKLFGILAIIGFLYSRTKDNSDSLPFTREMTYLVMLFVQLVICIPFAIYRGGSFNLVFLEFSEVVILTIILALTANTIERLWRLILIQSVGVITITLISLVNDKVLESQGSFSRVTGAIGGAFENPNDLAVGIAIVFPFCFMFLLRSRGFVRKLLWTASLLLLARAVLMTYSRGGFLALAAGALFSLYEFGIRGKRWKLLAYVGVAVGLIFVSAGPANYGARIATIFSPDSDVTGSSQQRREILITSLKTTAAHPIFGIGPGDFPIISGYWLVTHNTYTQLSAEAGIPALVLFLLIFGRSFKNINSARLSAPNDDRIQLLAGALRGATAAFLVGAIFASLAYQFYPYFLVAYASALCAIAKKGPLVPKQEFAPKPRRRAKKSGMRKTRALVRGGAY